MKGGVDVDVDVDVSVALETKLYPTNKANISFKVANK